MATERPILQKIAIGAAFVGGGLSAADLTATAKKVSDVATREGNSAKISYWMADHLTKAQPSIEGLRVTVGGKVYGCNDTEKNKDAFRHLIKIVGTMGDGESLHVSFGNIAFKSDAADIFYYPGYYSSLRRYEEEVVQDGGLLISGTRPNPPRGFVDDTPFHFNEQEIGRAITNHTNGLFNLEDAVETVKQGQNAIGSPGVSSVRINGKICIEDTKGRFSSLEPQIKQLQRNGKEYKKNARSERRKSQEYGFGVVGSAIAFGYGFNRMNLFTRQRKGKK